MAEDNIFRGAPAEQHRHAILELAARHDEAILARTLDRVTERTDAARDDRDFVYGVDAGQRHRGDRMPHLVIGDDLALLGAEDAAPLLEPGDDALDGIAEIGHGHRICAAARREQRCFVDQVGEIRTGETGS